MTNKDKARANGIADFDFVKTLIEGVKQAGIVAAVILPLEAKLGVRPGYFELALLVGFVVSRMFMNYQRNKWRMEK